MPRTFAHRAGTVTSARKPFVLAFALLAACCAALGFAPFSQQVVNSQDASAAGRTLSMDERVMYQRAVDEVYWRHTVWPKENQNAKPSLDEVVTREQTAAKVEDTLRKSEALERRWGRPVSPEQLQSEVERQARETRSPEVLRELWQALGNDPYVVAEILARPALVDRLARTSFAGDEQSGGAEASFDSWWAGASAEFTGDAAPASDFSYSLGEINQAGADDTWKPTQSLPVGTGTAVWTGTEVIVWGGGTSAGGRTNLGSRYNPATDTWVTTSTVNAPDARSAHTAVWTGTEMIVWGGSNGVGRVNTGGRYNPQTDSWTPTAPGNVFRSGHTVVWTGSKMIIWGGCTTTGSDTCRIGGVYDPAADTWTPTTLTNAPTHRIGHRAVWTGTEMIVWGGSNSTAANTGGRYNPDTDSWKPTNTFNAPSARAGFTMVWTGTEAVVWGGYEGNFITLNTGGRYNPQTDTWTPTSTANTTAARFGHTAVWTGTEMVVYGGDLRPVSNQDQLTNTGGRYNPSTNSWSPISTAGAPFKNNHVAVWTGTEMFVWGGSHVSQSVFRQAARYKPSTDSWIPTNNQDSVPPTNLGVWSGAELLVWGKAPGCISACGSTGGRYNPATNSWSAMSVTGAPAGDSADGGTAVWTGKEMIVWPGGGRYNPLTNTWARTSTAGAPTAVSYPTAVWSGSEMLVWGGDNNPDNTPSAGGRYNPDTNTWRPMTTTNAPAARRMHSAVWTGSEMVVWGGMQYFGELLDTGGRYNPQTDTWQPTSTAGAPAGRFASTAVWTGTEMIVWGGHTGESNSNTGIIGTGGRYNPASDSWQPTSATGAPAARFNHRAVWTGSTMIVWGGNVAGVVGPDATYTGARYNPASDLWTATSLQSAPSRRHSHVQVWTGTQMIVWGGAGTQDGAVYNAPGASQDNTSPSVRLTSPAEGAHFVAGNNIQLAAEASDADGQILSVSFYANDTLVGTDSEAPYTFDWNKVRSGNYALTAAATDNAGAVTRSAPVQINVEALIGPPNAVITSPADESSFEAPATVHVAADVTPNPDRDVTKVEFWLSDGLGPQRLVNTDTTAPYGFDLTNQPEGSYVIYAFAYDGEDVGISPGARFTVADSARPFNISGQIADDRGVVLANITVQLTGTDTATAKTNASGFYFFGSLRQGGNYTVTPSATNYTYAPQSLVFNNLAATQSNANFVATQAGYGISGRLVYPDGTPIYPATVNLSGSKTATTGTDINGYYFFSNLAGGGTYTVQPYKNQFAFEPGFRTFENLSAAQQADFTGTPQGTTYTVSGRVVEEFTGAPVAGLRVRLSQTFVASGVQYRTTDADGRFSFAYVPARENISVAPEDFTQHYYFVPANRTYTGVAQNVADADFVATTRAYPITGRLTDQNGNPIAQAVVNLLGSNSGSAETDADGRYSFKALAGGGDYVVQPYKDQYNFSAPYKSFDDLGAAQSADFVGAREGTTVSVAGRFLDSGGSPVAGLNVSLLDGQSATPRETTTDANGSYKFADLAASGDYLVVPADPDYEYYTFAPANRQYAPLVEHVTDANFVVARTNFALASNGATATASSTLDSNRTALAAINGDRRGQHWGSDPSTGSGWHDSTGDAYPDWLEVNFGVSRNVSEVSVFGVQDDVMNPSEPTAAMTFSQYGLDDFEVQYWTGSAWATVPGGVVTNNNKVWTKLTFEPLTTDRIRVVVSRAHVSYSRIVEVEAYGVGERAVQQRSNVALASAGATATASSTLDSNRTPLAAINGDRRGQHWGSDPSTGSGWHDATADQYPDWLEVAFSGAKTIDEVDVFSVQDDVMNPSDPTSAMTFSQYGVTNFEVQYWTGSAWAAVPGGVVTNNNKVWVKLTFAPLTTDKIRVVVTGAQVSYSRIVEVEAYQVGAAAPARVNHALASNGATASASSTLDPNRTAIAAINGDRRGAHWGSDPSTGSGWHDSTADAYPDWLEVQFAGEKSITEVSVFSVQDDVANPSDPSESMTFSQYGLTSFEVQYWTGSAWATIPGASVTNNNKVWRKLTFAAVQTTKIRVVVTGAQVYYSRITEVEAY